MWIIPVQVTIDQDVHNHMVRRDNTRIHVAFHNKSVIISLEVIQVNQ